MKKIAVIILTLGLLVASPFLSGAAGSENFMQASKNNESIRIIVELDDAPVIEKATQQGLRFKQMSVKQADTMRASLNAQHVSIKDEIKAKQINIKYHNDFVNVMNGFSATASASDLEKIQSLPGVKRVSIAQKFEVPAPQPNMVTSKGLVKAHPTWDLGYKGQGKVVAIIDTCLDYTHKDMRLSDEGEGKLSQEKVEQIVAAENLPGHWFSAKVPYGYNYADNNDNIRSGNPHGMHVAGIVGANCADESETDGIKGVAPEVQLLAMKVFSDDPGVPSCWEDVYIRAMEDSAVLGADVMNLSLGGDAGFVYPDPTYDTVQRVTANGVVVAMAAGNANCVGNGYQLPYAKNPDIGVVASPGNLPGTLQVASIDNSTMIKVIECGDQKIPYQNSNDKWDPVKEFTGPMEYIDCGLGSSNDFAKLDLTGKIALIKRGSITFETKILNAQNHGAVGVIIYNHESGGEDLVTMGLSDDDSIKIPAVFIGNHGGEVLKSLISTQIEFNGDEVPTAVKMSPFSSWGTTPNLDFKPDITAPGGNIYSTIPNNQYEVLSGTSMATPYVAGGTALVLQRMENDPAFSSLSGIERVTMAGNLLMSTARPQEVSEGVEVSPRRQGAGLMDLYAATTSMAIVRDPNTGLSKVNLKEIGDSATFNVSVSNFGEVDLRFQVSGTVLTSSPFISNGVCYIDTNDEQVVLDADKHMPISFLQTNDGIISVPAGKTVNFNVNLDLRNPVCSLKNQDSKTTSLENLNDIFPNGTFIEGFIRLTDVNEKVPQLSIPYLGFYGKWEQAPIFDDSLYNKDARSFYGVYISDVLHGSYMQSGSMILGQTENSMDPDLIAISPNGDGEQDDAQAVVELLRNAREMKTEILNEEGKELIDLGSSEYVTKNYNLNTSPLITPDWDGKINGVAIDGDYIYQLKARLDWEDSAWQTIDFPVRVDTVPPVIDSLVLDHGIITAHASDGNFPVVSYMLYDETRGVLASSADGVFDLSDLATIPYQLRVMAKDAAGNTTLSELLTTGTDKTKPEVYLQKPTARGFYNTHKIVVNGYVEEDNQLVSLQVGGNNIGYTYNADEKRYDFNTTITLEDGSQNLTIRATDSAGNSSEFVRRIYIDTIAPVINVTPEPPATVSSVTETVSLAALVDENMGGLTVYLNGHEIYHKTADVDLESKVLLPVHYEMPAQNITLDEKDNLISLWAADMAGNETVREFHVRRLQPYEETGPGGGGGSSGGSDAGGVSDGTSRTVNPDQQQTISTNGAQIYIPQDAVGEQVKISVQILSSAGDLAQQDRLISAVYEFSKDKTGNFLKPVKITLPFDLTKLDRDKDTPALCWFNESSHQWVEIENCEVDWDKGEIAGSVDHFTKFAVLMSADKQTKELTDIAGHWAQDNINKLVQEKIINGYEDGSFRPDQSISRAEFCTMLVKYLALDTADSKDIGTKQTTTSFADIKTHWAKSYIETAYKVGIVNGYDAQKFGPDDPITREQMTVMIGKAIKIEASGDTMAFSDTDKIAAWAAPFVTAAVHEKLISGYPDSSFKPQGNATRAEAVTIIVKLSQGGK